MYLKEILTNIGEFAKNSSSMKIKKTNDTLALLLLIVYRCTISELGGLMEAISEQDLLKMRELLRHAGEFIAYFELAESKMIAWRQEIEQQAHNQQEMLSHQVSQLQNELSDLQEVLTQAGLARLRITAEQALQQGESHLQLMQDTSQQVMEELQAQQRELNKMLQKHLQIIEQHTSQSINQVSFQLRDYDIHQFHRIADESCFRVEESSKNAVQQCSSLLKSFQKRVFGMTLITSLVAALAIGLYANNEWPWEMHQHARNEREAGRTLLKAWPNLSEPERNKILSILK